MAHYIDKDAVVAKIERLKDSEPYYPTLAERYAYTDGVNDVIDKIYSFETKEVGLEKEIDNYMAKEWEGVKEEDKPFYEMIKNDLSDIAKHFFELGLKAQRGEEAKKTNV